MRCCYGRAMTLTEIADGLERYVVDHGADHDDDCPGDDTCDCSQKPINDAANAACHLIRSMAVTERDRTAADDAPMVDIGQIRLMGQHTVQEAVDDLRERVDVLERKMADVLPDFR